MKILHLATVMPHGSGLYESAHDLVAAERASGLDSCIIDPNWPIVDRDVPIGGGERVAGACDVIVSHSGLGLYAEIQKPIVQVFHGRPESSYRLEQQGVSAVVSGAAGLRNDPRYQAFVTLWQSHVPFWSLVLDDIKIDVANPPIDLAAWSPTTTKRYDFHGQRGELNVVCSDMWRSDKTPFCLLPAFALFADQNPGAKLHLYGVPDKRDGLEPVLERLRERGQLGEVCGRVDCLKEVYQAADMLISPHGIVTRAIGEALACGCPVVAGAGIGLPISVVNAEPDDPYAVSGAMNTLAGLDRNDVRTAARTTAENEFDSMRAAASLKAIYEKVLEAK